MSYVDTDAVLDNLTAYLEQTLSTTFKSYSRRLKPWTEVSDQPALFVRHTADTDEYPGQIVFRRTEIEAEVWIYARTEDDDDAPDKTITQLVTLVRNAFAPDDPCGRFTLGQTVFWCRVEGRSEYDPGDLDKQAKAIIPVKILSP